MIRTIVFASLLSLTGTHAFAAGDAAAGEKYFNRICKACHSVQPGKNGVGPSLAGVVGRKAGTAAGFKFSPSYGASGATWNAQTLDTYLTDPRKMMKGSRMITKVAAPADRANVIAYLATLK
ncbi:MAG: c-type cytochrome [Sphingomonadales bacterium]|nr:MAG: c-type cytochrome [Sphingomonadales bacterium]